MENYQSNKRIPDSLDILLGAAAESAGNGDIENYLTEKRKADFSAQFLRRMKRITSKEVPSENTKSIRPRFFARRLVAACLCALIVCTLTVIGIAGIKRDSAQPHVTKQGDTLVLVYDMNGIAGKEQKISEYKAPQIGAFREISRTESEYILSVTFENDEYIYTQKRLTHSYSEKVGNSDTLYFELLVSGKYSGIAAVTESSDTRTDCLFWNDGKYAYSLCGNGGIEILAALAESVYN